jgi:excisionase family DNA binding protein
LLHETQVPGLSLLPAGRQPLDASILLASPNMDAILELLTREFDLVLIDSPPLLVAPDATLLAMRVPATVMVVSPDKTSRRAARQARDSLKSREDTHVIGVALNGTTPGRYAQPYYYRRNTVPQSGYLGRLLKRLTEMVSSLPVIGRPSDPDLISVSEAAMILGMRHDTVKRWCKQGRLPAVKQGLNWWVKQDELQDNLLPPGTTRRLFKETSG